MDYTSGNSEWPDSVSSISKLAGDVTQNQLVQDGLNRSTVTKCESNRIESLQNHWFCRLLSFWDISNSVFLKMLVSKSGIKQNNCGEWKKIVALQDYKNTIGRSIQRTRPFTFTRRFIRIFWSDGSWFRQEDVMHLSGREKPYSWIPGQNALLQRLLCERAVRDEEGEIVDFIWNFMQWNGWIEEHLVWMPMTMQGNDMRKVTVHVIICYVNYLYTFFIYLDEP